MSSANYGFSVRVDGDWAEVRQRTVDALAVEGFGIVSEIDVRAVMKKKLDLDRAPYTILGACNPKLANQAIEAEPDIGLLLPCNVVVREDAPGQQVVAFMDPGAVIGLVKRPEVDGLAAEVRARLDRVAAALAG